MITTNKSTDLAILIGRLAMEAGLREETLWGFLGPISKWVDGCNKKDNAKNGGFDRVGFIDKGVEAYRESGKL